MQKEQIYEIMIGSVEPREVALPGKLPLQMSSGKAESVANCMIEFMRLKLVFPIDLVGMRIGMWRKSSPVCAI